MSACTTALRPLLAEDSGIAVPFTCRVDSIHRALSPGSLTRQVVTLLCQIQMIARPLGAITYSATEASEKIAKCAQPPPQVT